MAAYLELKEERGKKGFQQFKELMDEIHLLGRKLHDFVKYTDLNKNPQVQKLLNINPEDLMIIYRLIDLTYPA